jgi:hypothetical protein
MIDDPVLLTGAYAATSASISAIMAKVSPDIGPRVRHLFAGAAPMGVIFADLLEGGDSVTLHGGDLLSAGGLFVAGLASSLLASRLTGRKSQKAIGA